MLLTDLQPALGFLEYPDALFLSKSLAFHFQSSVLFILPENSHSFWFSFWGKGHLDSDQPTIRVRQGKGSRSRIVPVHPEFLNALVAELQFANLGPGPVVGANRSTAWRWVQAAVALDALTAGRRAAPARTGFPTPGRLCTKSRG